MLITQQEIIDRARTYVSDDHDDEKGWITPQRWLTLVQVEYGLLYKRWIRMGLIRVEPVQTAFSAPGTTIPAVGDPEGSGVLAIIGVAQDYGGGRFRVVTPGQSVNGAYAIYSENSSGPAVTWTAFGLGDSYTINLEPNVNSSGDYFVRWITAPIPSPVLSATLEMPFGSDERLVLGTARRALLKDSSASALLNRLIDEQEAETNFAAFGRNNGDGPRVRRVRPMTRSRNRGATGFTMDPQFWTYL